jgi:pimeloyl-ACP methyl ester carboxylesterase
VTSEFVDVPFAGRSVRIECQWITPRPKPLPAARGEGVDRAAPRVRADHASSAAGVDRAARAEGAPLVVFLHEGLGSVAMWRHYPQSLCDAGGYRGLVYSRPGYGRSTPRAHGEHWDVDFMHRQALELLPALFARLRIGDGDARPWLFGHSDGASIALIHAAAFPARVAGVVAVAPHIVVEDVSLRSIAHARDAYRLTDIKGKLARYHDDPDSAFFGWNDVWLDARFRSWSIESLLDAIACPILAVQGTADEYGTLAQVEGIRARAPQAEVVVLEDCGHSPHRDRPGALTAAVTDFIARHTGAHSFEGGVHEASP